MMLARVTETLNRQLQVYIYTTLTQVNRVKLKCNIVYLLPFPINRPVRTHNRTVNYRLICLYLILRLLFGVSFHSYTFTDAW